MPALSNFLADHVDLYVLEKMLVLVIMSSFFTLSLHKNELAKCRHFPVTSSTKPCRTARSYKTGRDCPENDATKRSCIRRA